MGHTTQKPGCASFRGRYQGAGAQADFPGHVLPGSVPQTTDARAATGCAKASLGGHGASGGEENVRGAGGPSGRRRRPLDGMARRAYGTSDLVRPPSQDARTGQGGRSLSLSATTRIFLTISRPCRVRVVIFFLWVACHPMAASILPPLFRHQPGDDGEIILLHRPVLELGNERLVKFSPSWPHRRRTNPVEPMNDPADLIPIPARSGQRWQQGVQFERTSVRRPAPGGTTRPAGLIRSTKDVGIFVENVEGIASAGMSAGAK